MAQESRVYLQWLKTNCYQMKVTLSMPPNLAVAHVAQEMPAVNTSAVDYVIDGDMELRQATAANPIRRISTRMVLNKPNYIRHLT
jgi:hypothetical protein